MDFAVTPLDGGLTAGSDATFTVSLRQGVDGPPLRGATVGGWLGLRGRTAPPAAAGPLCNAKAAAFSHANPLTPPALDLNGYYLVSMNGDASLSVIDPLQGFGGSRLVAAPTLAGPGTDWALTPDRQKLVVSEPSPGRVAIIEGATWRLLQQVPLPGASRLVLAPDSGQPWIAYTAGAGDDGVALLDLASGSIVVRLPTGAGPHDLAFAEGGRFLLVTNQGGAPANGVTANGVTASGAGGAGTTTSGEETGREVASGAPGVVVGGRAKPGHDTGGEHHPPEGGRNPPGGARNLAEGGGNPPGGARNLAEGGGNPPGGARNLAEGGGNPPGGARNLAEGARNPPGEARNPPEGERNLSQGGGNPVAAPVSPQGPATSGGSVSVIDTATRQVIGSIAVAGHPVSIAYAARARLSYVASDDGTITAIDAASMTATASIHTDPGPAILRFAPGDRFALVANRDTGRVSVIDSATNEIIQRIEVGGEPDQIVFSDELAYIRRRRSDALAVLPLAQIGKAGQPVAPASVSAGQFAPGGADTPVLADAIAQAPGHAAVVVANPADGTLYYYHEGMIAPQVSFDNVGAHPAAVLAADRSLQEVAAGRYQTVGRLPQAGTYDAVFYVDSPRLVQCFSVQVEQKPGEHATPRVAFTALPPASRAGQPVAVSFHLIDPDSGAPVADAGDVMLLTFRQPGDQQAQTKAEPTADGGYTASFEPLGAGSYYVFVESRSLGLRPTTGGLVTVSTAATP